VRSRSVLAKRALRRLSLMRSLVVQGGHLAGLIEDDCLWREATHRSLRLEDSRQLRGRPGCRACGRRWRVRLVRIRGATKRAWAISRLGCPSPPYSRDVARWRRRTRRGSGRAGVAAPRWPAALYARVRPPAPLQCVTPRRAPARRSCRLLRGGRCGAVRRRVRPVTLPRSSSAGEEGEQIDGLAEEVEAVAALLNEPRGADPGAQRARRAPAAGQLDLLPGESSRIVFVAPGTQGGARAPSATPSGSGYARRGAPQARTGCEQVRWLLVHDPAAIRGRPRIFCRGAVW
jgi:hypothetical protein